MQACVLEDADLLLQLGSSLDELHARTATPVTARRPWLQTWLDCYPRYRPLGVVVFNSDGRLEAAAILAHRRRRGFTEVVPVGSGPSDQVRLPAVSDQAAALLADTLLRRLQRLRRPWRLTARHVPTEDRVASALLAHAPAGSVAEGDVSPATRFDKDRSLRSYVSRNHHQQVRRMLNRMQREGLEPAIDVLRKPDEIEAVLPEIERISRLRDENLQRPSQLDDPSFGPFFRRVTLTLAAQGEVELITLRLGGTLGAFVLCFVDGPSRRMWSTRLDPQYGRFGVGRVANNAALEHALSDPSCKEFDWMRGEEGYKSSMANHDEVAQDLFVWSSRVFALSTDAPRRLKMRLKAAKADDERVLRAWDIALRLRSRAQLLLSRSSRRS